LWLKQRREEGRERPKKMGGGALRNHLASTEASTPESAPNSN
jgi:hypothetical protein